MRMKIDFFAPTLTLSICLSHLVTTGVARSSKTTNTRSTIRNHHFQEDSGGQQEKFMWDNGALPLVLAAFTDKIVTEMEQGEESVESLNQPQSKLLAEKLKGIYAHLMEHPALMERRLYVGSKKPEIPPHPRLKRTFHEDIAQPVCPDHTQWELLHLAQDINDTYVEVFQPEMGSDGIQQWFYTVTCDNEGFRHKRECPGCCMGINHEKYNSSCRQKRNYVMALVRRYIGEPYDWNWIQVNTACTCAVSQKFDVLFDL